MKLFLSIVLMCVFLNANETMPKNNSSLSLNKEEQAYLNTKPYLTVMSLENFQPFNFIQNNKPSGYSIEVINLMGKYLNKDIKYIDKTWSEQLEMLKNGQLDIIPHIAINSKRKEFVEYTDFVHLTFLIGFATNRENTLNSMKDLVGRKLAVVQNTYLEDYLTKSFPEIKLYKVKNREEAVQAVATKKAYAVVDNIPTLDYFIHKKWMANLKFVKIDDFGMNIETQMPMGVSKGNIVLKSILEKTYKAISPSEFKKIQNNWLSVMPKDSTQNTLTDEEKAYLKKKKKILMCVLPHAMPFDSIDKNGKHKGIGADFMKQVSEYIDTPMELFPTKKWIESLDNINKRNCDILPIAIASQSRKKTMNFTKPYLSEPFVIATTIDKRFIKDESELSHRKIGAVRGYAFVEDLKKNNPLINIVDVKNTEDGLKKVSSGELFGYIDAMSTIGYDIQRYTMLDLKIAGRLKYDTSLSVASRNDEPLLNSILQKALDSIDEDKKRTIVGHWISIKVAQEFDYSTLWKICIVFLVILFAIIYKNTVVNKINKKLRLAHKSIEEQQKMVDKYVLILTTDLNGTIVSTNDAFLVETGFQASELKGETLAIMRHPDMQASFFSNMWKTIKSDKCWSGEIKNFTKDKKTIWLAMHVEPIFKDDKKIGYRSIAQNITDKKMIEKFSVTDQLTQLYNRHYLEKAFVIEMERAARYKTDLSMLMLDIDYFKDVNDTYGHEVGDETLQSMAETLQDNVRKTDIVGRWGGEEFIILLPNTTSSQAEIVAEKIRKTIEEYEFKIVKHKTISIGISKFIHGETKEVFVNKADKALYRAKEMGRNTVEIYS